MDNIQEISSSQEIGIFNNYYNQNYGPWPSINTLDVTDVTDVSSLFSNLGYVSNDVQSSTIGDDIFIQAGSSRYQEFMNSTLVKDETLESSSSPTSMGTIETVTSSILDNKSTSQVREVPRKIPSSLPASENWAGDYDFQIFVEKTIKNSAWMYSPPLEKLFILMGAPCPISFSTNCPMPDKVKIRAMVLYSSPESVSEVVQRCRNHIEIDVQNNELEAEYLVRCASTGAVYDTDEVTGHQSVLVPFENPCEGQSFSTYLYKFTCLSSCAVINRRPLMIVFSLLDVNGRVVGRRKLNIKICACPSRDLRAEERFLVAGGTNLQGVEKRKPGKHVMESKKKKKRVEIPEVDNVIGQSSKTKKIKTEPNPDGFYQIKVKDKKCFEFLEQMKNYYDMMKTFKNMPTEVKEKLKRYQQRKGFNLNFDE